MILIFVLWESFLTVFFQSVYKKANLTTARIRAGYLISFSMPLFLHSLMKISIDKTNKAHIEKKRCVLHLLIHSFICNQRHDTPPIRNNGLLYIVINILFTNSVIVAFNSLIKSVLSIPSSKISFLKVICISRIISS